MSEEGQAVQRQIRQRRQADARPRRSFANNDGSPFKGGAVGDYPSGEESSYTENGVAGGNTFRNYSRVSVLQSPAWEGMMFQGMVCYFVVPEEMLDCSCSESVSCDI